MLQATHWAISYTKYKMASPLIVRVINCSRMLLFLREHAIGDACVHKLLPAMLIGFTSHKIRHRRLAAKIIRYRKYQCGSNAGIRLTRKCYFAAIKAKINTSSRLVTNIWNWRAPTIYAGRLYDDKDIAFTRRQAKSFIATIIRGARRPSYLYSPDKIINKYTTNERFRPAQEINNCLYFIGRC